MCKLVKLFNSKDEQKHGCKQILTQNSLVKSTQQKILNSRKFEFSSCTVAVQLPPQQQSHKIIHSKLFLTNAATGYSLQHSLEFCETQNFSQRLVLLI